jgi:hypothetical protein
MQVVNKKQMSLHQIACYFWGLLLYTSITPILTSKPSGTHKMKRFKRLLRASPAVWAPQVEIRRYLAPDG